MKKVFKILKYAVIKNLNIKPLGIFMYLPQITWKGDCVGHIGENDVFFWVLEGECFLLIDDEATIVRPGQLAYLPKGKKRMYTHASERFSMYEMAFSAEADGQNLMSFLGLTENNYVVDISDYVEMSTFFEKSYHAEMFKNPIYDVEWCANILNIIKTYAEARNAMAGNKDKFFEPVLKIMSESIDRRVTTEELAGAVYTQPTYFIRKFTKAFGISPQNYFSKLKLFRAMNLLVSTKLSVEDIARKTGMEDASYFSRFFKKNCGVTPIEYRKAFRK